MLHAAPLPSTPARRRAGVIRRALRREVVRIRDPQRAAAMILLILVFAIMSAAMVARGESAGADARAYWAAVRIWLEGGSPYHPTGPFLPYVYAPWMLPLFAPWALLPWEVAWFVWRGGTILLFLWSVRWAYARRPLATAILIALLIVSIASTLDTGNITLLLALMCFAVQFTGPRVGGFLWGIATWMKWVPAPLFFVLPARTRLWGIVFLAISGALSLLMLPLTIVQLQVLFGFGERPFRADYLVLVWSAVPWWWRLRDPFAFLRPASWGARLAAGRARVAAAIAAVRASPSAATRAGGAAAVRWARHYVGLD